MRTTNLIFAGGPAAKKASVLGMGCAPMLGRAGRRESLAALAAAYDAGITFYDTARSYGYGACEALLGEYFHGARRDAVVLCTKFGILPANSSGWKNKVKPLARAVLSVAPGLRGAVRKHAASQFNPGQFSVETLRSSFETSLRELKTDYVDMLLMHNPPLASTQQEDLLEAMGRLVDAGKVRMAGVSADGEVIGAILSEHSPVLKAAQFPLNLFSMQLARQTTEAAKSMFLIANHPFGGAEGIARGRSEMERMRQDASLPKQLCEKLDPRDETLLPEVVLNCILQGTGISVAIPSMLQPTHLKNNIRAVEQCRFSAAELELVRNSMIASASAHAH
ncbi:MAG TPA: aldo/keto reductase [Terracidiphilus sp.]|jgi:aryl-alcohol dehydrogenase-like predicted oxidoreductase